MYSKQLNVLSCGSLAITFAVSIFSSFFFFYVFNIFHVLLVKLSLLFAIKIKVKAGIKNLFNKQALVCKCLFRKITLSSN